MKLRWWQWQWLWLIKHYLPSDSDFPVCRHVLVWWPSEVSKHNVPWTSLHNVVVKGELWASRCGKEGTRRHAEGMLAGVKIRLASHLWETVGIYSIFLLSFQQRNQIRCAVVLRGAAMQRSDVCGSIVRLLVPQNFWLLQEQRYRTQLPPAGKSGGVGAAAWRSCEVDDLVGSRQVQ